MNPEVPGLCWDQIFIHCQNVLNSCSFTIARGTVGSIVANFHFFKRTTEAAVMFRQMGRRFTGLNRYLPTRHKISHVHHRVPLFTKAEREIARFLKHSTQTV